MNRELEKRRELYLSILGCTDIKLHETVSISFLRVGNKCVYSLKQVDEMIKNNSLFTHTIDTKD